MISSPSVDRWYCCLQSLEVWMVPLVRQNINIIISPGYLYFFRLGFSRVFSAVFFVCVVFVFFSSSSSSADGGESSLHFLVHFSGTSDAAASGLQLYVVSCGGGGGRGEGARPRWGFVAAANG